MWSGTSSPRTARPRISRAATEDAAIVTVSTTHPKPTDPTGSELILPGTVQANIDAPIYARTSGYLKRWLVDIGTRVKAGQLLAEIDTPEVQQQMSAAQADAATAEANQKIAAVTAERWQSLRKTDSVSKQDADEKESLADASKAQLDSARANLQRPARSVGLSAHRCAVRRHHHGPRDRRRPADHRWRRQWPGAVPHQR